MTIRSTLANALVAVAETIDDGPALFRYDGTDLICRERWTRLYAPDSVQEPEAGDVVGQLVRAGAQIAAEIDQHLAEAAE